MVLGLIGLLVVAGVIAAIVISSGDGGNSDQASNSDTAVTEESAGPEFTKHSACALEVNVGLDIVLNSGYDSQGLAQVVGSQNAQYPLYTQMVQPFVNYQTQYGRSGAADRIGADVAMACTEAGDPVLTQGQVADMTRLDAIEPSDAQALRRIDYFE